VERGGTDLIPVATIYSRPEMACFVSVLEAEGIQTYTLGYFHGSLEQNTVLLGGYSVRVPEYHLEQAVSLIEEVRLGTKAEANPFTVRRRTWRMLFGLLAIGIAEAAGIMVATSSTMVFPIAAACLLLPVSVPYPMSSPGDYRSRSGRMVQLV
jgi:hypothetical protein